MILGSFALRLYNLGGQSLWFDEGWSWHLAKLPLGDMLSATAGDRSPPVYYALLHIWMQLAGESEFSLRFISALADTLTVALVVAFAGELMGRWARAQVRSPPHPHTRSPALLAGLIYAVMPFAVWYAQETRMYALVAMLCTASSLALMRWLRRVTNGEVRVSSKLLITSAVLLALAIYCHYYAIFLLPAQFVVILLFSLPRDGRALKHLPITNYSITAFVVLLSLAPWLAAASAGFAYDDGFHFPLNTIDGRLLEWLRGYAGAGLARPLPDWWPIALLIPVMLGIIGFVARRNWRGLLTVLALIAVPLLAATIAVRVVYPNRSVFHPRYLIYVAPMTAVLFAQVFGILTVDARRQTTQRALSIVCCLSSVVLLSALWLPLTYAYLTDPALQREDTRGAVMHVIEALAPGDAVVMSRDNFAVRYYWPSDKASYLFAVPDGLHGILKSDAAVIDALNRAPLKRVRLMLWQDDVVDPQTFVEASLWPNGFEQGEFNFAQIRLPLYQVDHWPLQPPHFVDVGTTFGNQLRLHSHWQDDRGFAGDWFYVVLNWRPATQITTDYKVFIHVLDMHGKLMWQNDKQPLNALLPMTRWQPGETYRDAHAMVIPADVPAGRYRVVVGVYDPAAGRLMTSDGQDHIDLGEVEVLRR